MCLAITGTGGRYKRTRRVRDVVTETPLLGEFARNRFVCDEHLSLSLSPISIEGRLYEILRRHRGGKRYLSWWFPRRESLDDFRSFFKVFYQERIREKNLGKGIGILAAIDFLPLRRKAFETKYIRGIWLSATDENR